MEKFFNPKSVALVGVPRKTGVGAYNNLEILLKYGYKGQIFPINPKAEQICGLRCYSSVLEIPESADLAVIAVGRDRVPAVFDQCCQKGIKRVVIISQGFADGDEQGKQLQEDLAARAKSEGVRIIGPNTLGVYNVYQGFNTGFVDHYKPQRPDPVCMIAQTGVYQAGAKVFSENGFAKAIDIGNACDVDVVDVLEYLENDPETKVIAVHMEGIKRGKEFVKIARRVTMKKPIVILKTGRSAEGARAALSHTGSLVGDDEVFDAAFEKAGVIRVRSNSELQDAIKALVHFPPMNGRKIAVITATGALGIISTDACKDFGLELGPVPPYLPSKILKGLPEWVNLSNPIDIWPIGMISGKMPQVFETVLTDVLDSKDIDAVAVVWVSFKSPLHSDIDFREITARVQRTHKAGKPIAFWFYGDDVEKANKEYGSIAGVACFPTIERAIRGLSFIYRYHRKREEPKADSFDVKVDRPSRDKLVKKGNREKILVGEEAFALLNAYGIPTAPGKVVHKVSEALEAASSLGYPVVCKVSDKNFIHKTEIGAVEINISSEEELKRAFNRLLKLVKNRNNLQERPNILVQKQIRGHELLLGLKRDPCFGMVLVCGQGGIYTEIYKDTARSLTPVSLREAQRMLSKLKLYPILKGIRGQRGVDLDQIASAICRLSALAEDIEGLMEVDINPFMVNSSGSWAVDSRFIW